MLEFFRGGLFEIGDDAEEPQAEATRKSLGAPPPTSSRGRRPSTPNPAEEQEEDDDQPADYLTHQPMSIVGGTMRSYQLEGLNWMIRLRKNGLNGILADEMGLGKTLQSISMLAYLHEYQNTSGPHIVLVPKTTLSNWLNEFARWLPALRVVKFHGAKDERAETAKLLLDGVSNKTSGEKAAAAAGHHPRKKNKSAATITQHEGRTWDVVVTTYEVANLEKATLTKLGWRMLIVDEAHRIKNENAQLSKTVRQLQVENRLLITGTPLQNNLHELWALLNFLLPDVFASSEKFDELFNLQIVDADAKKAIIEQLHKLLRPFVLRRLKHDVEKSLPPKSETILFTPMSDTQREVYRNCLLREIDVVQGGVVLGKGSSSSGRAAAGGASRTAVLNLAMQLRKCCNHPYLFPHVEDRTLPPLGRHLIDNCGKLVLLDKLLVRLKEKGHRVLIFSQMTRVLDILEDYMAMRQYSYCRIDGKTPHDLREAQIDQYNAAGSDKFAFLLSTRAGGLGVNLQTADTCVLYDSDWNPQADLQAMDRCHRIGQTKPVHVYRLVTEHSIEEKVVERAQQKLKLDAVVVQQGRLQEKQSKVKTETLLHAVRFGADKVFRPTASVTDEDIDAIVERGQKRTAELEAKLAKADKGDMLDFKLDGGMDVQTWDGVDYSDAAKRNAMLGAEKDASGSGGADANKPFFLDTGKRERKKTSTALYSEQLEQREPSRKKKKLLLQANALGGEADEKNGEGPTHGEASNGDGLSSSKNGGGGDANGAGASNDSAKKKKKGGENQDDGDGNLLLSPSKDKNSDKKPPKPPKWMRLPKLEDWQFFDKKERLQELAAKEERLFGEYFQSRPDRKAAYLEDPLIFDVREVTLLTKAEDEERRSLWKAGFGHVSKHDYAAFVKASGKYGRANYEKIAEDLWRKSPAQVERYAEAFWAKGKQFLSAAEWDRASRSIEKGEKKLEEMEALFETTKKFVELFGPNARHHVVIRFANTSAGFPQFPGLPPSPIEERVLLWALVEYGYGNWRQIRDVYRNAPELMFDWYVQSMDLDAVQRRAEALMRAAEKELAELERRWAQYQAAAQAIAAARAGAPKHPDGRPLSQPERVARMFEKMRDDHQKQLDLRSELKAAKHAKQGAGLVGASILGALGGGSNGPGADSSSPPDGGGPGASGGAGAAPPPKQQQQQQPGALTAAAPLSPPPPPPRHTTASPAAADSEAMRKSDDDDDDDYDDDARPTSPPELASHPLVFQQPQQPPQQPPPQLQPEPPAVQPQPPRQGPILQPQPRRPP
eukprot:CAMPEP_0118900094 /NCGR_PEP_ID=MMETSP1166-20130328/6361_1 /TAXON_ID=1104430 /ORGANISM="Chrysoreinhardia sp, Strain CCMP3193" /LENGTH=1283 /DNA_ID=CAMNT_0006839229 /DNA_START=441 /DNA_END=4288 /DNA_ORIENTATION=+